MIIDDGSTDRTVEVAQRLSVDHIVRNKQNIGLARSFRNGLDACLKLGADIIVNTDGDNQYVGADIPKLVQPILDGEADIVIGDRQTAKVSHFSPVKKFLQRLAAASSGDLAGIRVPDTVSGFRAFSREAAIRLNIVSAFSYTIETVIQAGRRQLAVTSVPIRTNPKTRDSRLFKSIPHFIQNSAGHHGPDVCDVQAAAGLLLSRQLSHASRPCPGRSASRSSISWIVELDTSSPLSSAASFS